MTTAAQPTRRARTAAWILAAGSLAAAAIYHEPIRHWFAAEAPEPPVHLHDHGAHGTATEIAYYTCPMHPAVRRPGPGKCPICGMELTPVTREARQSGAITIDDAQRKRVGIETSRVRRAPMSVAIRALGRVTYDESKLVDVTLRVAGFIRDLRVSETGQAVSKGAVLFSLWSPELYAAQQEYLLARVIVEGSAAAPARGALARAARKRLLLLGMAEAQIAAIERRGEPSEAVTISAPSSGFVLEKDVVEGAAVEVGQRLYRIAPLDRVWVQAEVYEQDLRHVHNGQQVVVSLPYLPGRTFDGTVSYVYPYLEGSTRTGLVRIELPNRDLALKADMYADVLFALPLGERLQVPASAVVYTGKRRLVFVDRGQGKLVPTEVTLGVRADEAFEVLSGLEDGDAVVTAGNFLVAAESRIRGAVDDDHEASP